RHVMRGSWWRVRCSRGRQYTTQGETSLEDGKDGMDVVYTLQQRGIILSLLNTATESQLELPPPLHSPAAESIVSIVFGMKKLAWAHVDHTRTVRDWQQRECFHFEKGRYMPELYLEAISEVISQLSQADFYILEQPLVPMQKSLLFPVALHYRTVEAMLYSLLNPQIIAEREHRVFSMHRSTVGKHFELMLGQVKTSGVDVVQRLIDEAAIVSTPRVNFPSELLQQNQHQSRGQNRKEEMCDALLQAITFYELVHF
ncbi:PREDICTED: transcription elongation factor, mitochondrial, partial [Nanorana parkeri]|uniref:transcription elongation factor, mitochondrial n=1 Tax=Nanorana parkeri TaxID=125878 RepID=UPI00085466AD